MKKTAGQKCTVLLIIIALHAIFGLPAPFSASAQEPETEENIIVPIPTSEIIQSAEALVLKIQEANSLLVPQRTVQKIEKELGTFFEEIQRMQTSDDMKRLSNISASKLNDLFQKWSYYSIKLNDWQSILNSRYQRLESKRLEMLSQIELWTLSYETAQAEQAPVQILERLQALLQEIAETEAKLKDRLDHNINIQSRLSNKLIEIEYELALVGEALIQKKDQIFRIDSPPFWNVFNGNGREKHFSVIFVETMERHGATLSEFYSDFKEKIIIHFVLFLFILSLMLILRNFGNKLISEKAAAEVSKDILNHPYSVAVLIALLFTRSIYPLAPEIILKLAQLISLGPVLRLLPVLSVPKIRNRLIIFFALYLLTLIYVLSPEQSITHRIFLLIINTLALGFFILIVKKKAIRRLGENNRLVMVTSYLFRIGIPLMIVGLIANLIGNTGLASLLIVGTLSSIYMLVVLIAGALVLISVFNLLMSTHFANMSRIIRIHHKRTKKILSRFIFLLALYFWIRNTLEFFNIDNFVYGWLGEILSARLQVGSVDLSLADILIFIITIYFSLQLSRLIRFLLEEDILTRLHLPRGVPGAISMLANYFVIGIGFLIAVSAAGFDLSRLAIIMGALSVGIGFGLQNIVNNFISGLILIFERPIQVGDVVELNALLGTVKRIGIRSSAIRTYDGSEVIVPNANLISNEVINWTLSDNLRRIQIRVGTTYSSDPGMVLGILKGIVQDHPDITTAPEPVVLFEEFGDSSLNFNLRFWTKNSETWPILKSEISVRIYNAFKEHGIEIPFPQRDLHLRSADAAIIDKFVK